MLQTLTDACSDLDRVCHAECTAISTSFSRVKSEMKRRDKWNNMTRKKCLNIRKAYRISKNSLIAATKVIEGYGNVCGQGSEFRLFSL